MNKRQKEVIQHQLDSEKAVLERLEKQYKQALNDINTKIRILQSDKLTQSRIYHIQYQKALKKQVTAILEKLHSDEFSTIQQYLSNSYTDSFIGTFYDIAWQGIPIITPIDQKAAVKAIMTDTRLNKSLYDELGVDINELKKAVSAEITRGLATGSTYEDMARNLSFKTKAPLARANTIIRTEGHRIQQASAEDARQVSKSKGADVVKMWDATLDGDTRDTHMQLDGQIRETDKPFEANGKEAMYPGDFGDPAEDCNCRCVALTRARWALDEDELETLKERAEFFGLDKTKDFDDFKKKYLAAVERIQTGGKIVDRYVWEKRREKKAERAYDTIRDTNDIVQIAKSSGMSEEDVATIKNHVFFNTHELYDGPGRFVADYDMAVAWRRLAEGHPEERDILLLKHELLESQVEKEYNISASEAHAKATETYDWAGALYDLFGEDGEPDGLL